MNSKWIKKHRATVAPFLVPGFDRALNTAMDRGQAGQAWNRHRQAKKFARGKGATFAAFQVG